MIDLTDILIRAQEHCLWSKQALSVLIRQIPVLSFSWDMECGERWASIELYGNFVGYISSFIPLCFCKTSSLEEIINFFGDRVLIVAENNFDEEKWFIDEKKFKKDLNGLSWIAEEGLLNFKKFSINDLWYATI